MKSRSVVFAAVALLFSFLPRVSHSQDAVTVFQLASPTVVRLFNSTSTGTGVVLTRDGMILTNAHVVSSPLPFQCTVEVVKAGKRQTVTFKKVKVTKIHKSMDLAIVQIDPSEHNAKLAACKLSKAKNPVGQRLYAIGNPATEDNGVLNKTITEGLLSGVDRLIDGVKYYQISAAINPGNSGGPICDSKGTVVGIVTLKQADVEGVGYAIPVFDIRMADFESYRRKTISAAKAKDLIRKSRPLLEQVRLETNRENNSNRSEPSLGLALKRAILFQICQEAAHYDPNNSEVFAQLGLVCFMEKEFDAARAYMLESIRLNPNYQSRPYELLSKSLSQLGREQESLIVDFEMLGKFSHVGHLWQYVATKLYVKGLRREGMYLMMHSIAAAETEGDRTIASESARRYSQYIDDATHDMVKTFLPIKKTHVSQNLRRMKKVYRDARNANKVFVTQEFANYFEAQTGTKRPVSDESMRIFALLEPEQGNLAAARVKMLSGNFESAVETGETLLKDDDPKIKRLALHFVADAYQQWGLEIAQTDRSINKYFYLSCDKYRELVKNHGPLSRSEKREFAFALYNEACCLALDGNKAKALKVLRESFEQDFPRPLDASEDKDFTSLHDDGEFKALVGEFSRR